ncbi:LptF/LptG family permease [Candidatus Sumerlaeota bacterium]|nr:LptF/LptG family permease [Candidatus Sumerlaeota bacterium]
MKLLHRYILKELIGPAILGLVIFTFVLLLQQLFDIIDLLMSRGVLLITVIQLLSCLIPQVLGVTIPMAVLVAALLAFGRLSTDREIMAIRTSGVRLIWLIWPAFALGAVLSLCLALMNMEIMPRLAIQLADLKYQLIFQTVTSLEPGRLYDNFASGNEDMNFMFEESGEHPGDLRGIVIQSVHEQRETGEERLIYLVAQRGRISSDLEHRAIRVSMADGTAYLARSDMEGPTLRVMAFEELEQLIYPELSRIKDGRRVKYPSEMRFSELGEAIDRETDSDRRARLQVERLRRWVFPFSALAFMMIGIPFGIVTKASGKGMGLAISFLLILAYYGLLEWGSAIAETGSRMAALAMWSPNIVLGMIGLTMLWWVGRR